jgi:hypothetical protein
MCLGGINFCARERRLRECSWLLVMNKKIVRFKFERRQMVKVLSALEE